MIEYLVPSFLYSILKDSCSLIRSKQRRLSNSQIVERRQKWKPLFEKHIWEQHRDKLTSEIIVRDMKRIDNYPEAQGDERHITMVPRWPCWNLPSRNPCRFALGNAHEGS
jgi:hypothetical protein